MRSSLVVFLAQPSEHVYQAWAEQDQFWEQRPYPLQQIWSRGEALSREQTGGPDEQQLYLLGAPGDRLA